MHCKPLAAVMAGLMGLGLVSARADDKVDHGFVDRVYRSAEGEESKYVLFVPYDYTGDKPCPLLVNLHGDGERATTARSRRNRVLGPPSASEKRPSLS